MRDVCVRPYASHQSRISKMIGWRYGRVLATLALARSAASHAIEHGSKVPVLYPLIARGLVGEALPYGSQIGM